MGCGPSKALAGGVAEPPSPPPKPPVEGPKTAAPTNKTGDDSQPLPRLTPALSATNAAVTPQPSPVKAPAPPKQPSTKAVPAAALHESVSAPAPSSSAPLTTTAADPSPVVPPRVADSQDTTSQKPNDAPSSATTQAAPSVGSDADAGATHESAALAGLTHEESMPHAGAQVEGAEEIVTGVLWKKGDAGTAGHARWSQRYIVISPPHNLAYFHSQAAFESGKAPRSSKRLDLRHFGVLRGPAPANGAPLLEAIADGSRASALASVDKNDKASFHLEPRPRFGDRRRWEFRAIEEEDLARWIDVFIEFGCVDEDALASELRAAAGQQSQSQQP